MLCFCSKGSNSLVAPEDIVYNPRPPLGPITSLFVSRGDTEESAVNCTSDVVYVERRGTYVYVRIHVCMCVCMPLHMYVCTYM